MNGQIVSRLYMAKDYAKALADHNKNPSVMVKVKHPSLGLCFEVIYIPLSDEVK